MALRTKSIQKPKAKNDGIRICIMRRPGPDANFDIWMPTLAPSHELLNAYHEGRVTWAIYEKRFMKEVISKNSKYIKLLCELSQKHDVTLLCWEDTPARCHRRLVTQACQRVNPHLSVVLK